MCVDASFLLSFTHFIFMFPNELGVHDAPFLSVPFCFSFVDGWHMGHLFCLVGKLSIRKVSSLSVKLCCDSSTLRLKQQGLSCKGLSRNPEEREVHALGIKDLQTRHFALSLACPFSLVAIQTALN